METKKQSSSAHKMGTLQSAQNFSAITEEQRNLGDEILTKNKLNLNEIFKDGNEEKLNSELLKHVQLLKNGKQIINPDFLEGFFYVNPKEYSIHNCIANRMFELKNELINDYSQKMKEAKSFAIKKYYFDECLWMDSLEVYDLLGEEEYYKILKEVIRNDTIGFDGLHYNESRIFTGENPLIMLSEKEKHEFEQLPQKLTLYTIFSESDEITAENIKYYLDDIAWTTNLENVTTNKEMGNSKIIGVTLDKSNIAFYYNLYGQGAVLLWSNESLKEEPIQAFEIKPY